MRASLGDTGIRGLLRAIVFGNLGVCLALSFAAAQSFLALWWLAMWSELPPVDPATWAAASALLAVLHVLILGRHGAARVLTQCFTSRLQAYAIVSFSFCIVAACVAATLAGALVASSLIGWAGPAHGLAFSMLRASTTAAAIAGLAVVATGLKSARARPVCRRIAIGVAGLPTAFEGTTIAHLSDLHVGNGFGLGRLGLLVDAINELGADLVVITGDIFDRDPSVVPDAAAVLARLQASLGVFVVLGNHDAYTGCEEIVEWLAKRAPALRVLRGDVVRVQRSSEWLELAGLDDPGEDWRVKQGGLRAVADLGKGLSRLAPAILLVHRPDVFGAAAAVGFDIVLAGHYHGGQIVLPGSGGTVNPARLLTERVAGSHRIGEATLHVSRGVGCTGPRLRIGCSPEFSLIELRRLVGRGRGQLGIDRRLERVERLGT